MSIPAYHDGDMIGHEVALWVQRFVQGTFSTCVLSVDVEIQDAGRFLLVVAEIRGATPVAKVQQVVDVTSSELGRRIPARNDEYAWMFVVKHDGEILQSRSGGWRGHANV